MLVELHVRDLGVIADLHLALGAGMTVLTGETGAGKTLVVEAVELLVGGRADVTMVRGGAAEALVEGRFVGEDGEEVVLSRSVAASGRPRASIDGRMLPVSALAERGRALVDLHGQHAHQSLLGQEGQRAALDRYGGVDHTPLRAHEARLRTLREEAAALGGDERERARTMDLLAYQLREIDQAAVRSDDEDRELELEETRLAGAAELRTAAEEVHRLLAGSGESRSAPALGAVDQVGLARASASRHHPLREVADRLAAVAAELDDLATDVRLMAEGFEEDPARLVEVGERRRQLADLRRKYGDTLADVRSFAMQARTELAALSSAGERAGALADEEKDVLAALGAAERVVATRRRDGATALAAEMEERLGALAMTGARVAVRVGDDPRGDDVQFLLGANTGEAALPLAKVASGGELARAMLALRLVLTGAPPTLVFDEVDAGIGGAAAIAVGRALADIGQRHQVLVVTHLAQVAAFADHHVAVRKEVVGDRTVATASPVEGDERLAELARMLSGRADSESGRAHAADLLAEARAGAAARSAGATGASGSVGHNP